MTDTTERLIQAEEAACERSFEAFIDQGVFYKLNASTKEIRSIFRMGFRAAFRHPEARPTGGYEKLLRENGQLRALIGDRAIAEKIATGKPPFEIETD